MTMIKKYMKIKFDSDDNLPLNKTKEIDDATIVVRAVFHQSNKYSQIFLRWMSLQNAINIEMLYYDRCEVSEGIDVIRTLKQVHQLSVIFVAIGIS